MMTTLTTVESLVMIITGCVLAGAGYFVGVARKMKK